MNLRGMAGWAVIALSLSLAYTVGMFATSRRRRPAPLPPAGDLAFVFVIPCLNEELVIQASLDRLRSLTGNVTIVVVDDGSDDGTSEIVARCGDDRVHLLRRTPPDARNGKGAALNAAYRYVLDSEALVGWRPEDVVFCVLDADGRLDSNALAEVAPYFSDPRTGAVQIGLRMFNADERPLARMQDMEFVVFTSVYQRGRQRIGSVGLGGNGQFTRLSALGSLGAEPWTHCLTEDLDLGVRLLAAGWITHFCPTTSVAQQAVMSAPRLIRQRARWFQGHLQCWSRVPLVLRSPLAIRTTLDLFHHLISPAAVLLMTPPVLLFLLAVGRSLAGAEPLATQGSWLPIVLFYGLAFGAAPFYAIAYWLEDRDTGLGRAWMLAHLYTLYTFFWFPAGWIAVGRLLAGRRGWAKTVRTVDRPRAPRRAIEPWPGDPGQPASGTMSWVRPSVSSLASEGSSGSP